MQRWFTERCWLLLCLLSPVCATPQYIARGFPQLCAWTKVLTFIAALPGVQVGPYHAYNCGTHAPLVSILINTLFATLRPVLDDVSQQTSSDTFNAFFKSITFAPIVHDILSNIIRGAPIAPGPHAIHGAPKNHFGPPVTPQLVCVTDYKQITWSLEEGGQGGRQGDAYSTCQQSPVNSFGVFGSKYLKNSIVLCPAFFDYVALPSLSKAACVPVDPHFNRFRDSGKRLVNYQLWVLLHELVHVYVYARSGSLTELSTANDCVSLAAGSAVNNAQNYVFYAASKSLITST